MARIHGREMVFPAARAVLRISEIAEENRSCGFPQSKTKYHFDTAPSSPFSCRSHPPLILDLYENVTLAPHRPSRASTISQTDFPTLIVTRARDLLFSLPFQPLARPNSEESEREGKIILRLTDLSAACDAFKFSCNVPLQIFQICSYAYVILNSEMSIQLRFHVLP